MEAPLCLLKLEFLLPEEKFVSSVEEAEKTLQQEKQQLQRKQNVKETLKKHKVCLKTYYWVDKQDFFLNNAGLWLTVETIGAMMAPNFSKFIGQQLDLWTDILHQ